MKGILCSVESEEDQIKIKYAGYEVACYPRTVVIESGNEIEAATEFVFDSFEKDPPEELWRFYLKRDGRLHLSLEDDSGLCDFDNPNVAKTIVVHVTEGLIQSSILAPSVGC